MPPLKRTIRSGNKKFNVSQHTNAYMSEINEDIKPYRGKGSVLCEVFEANSIETLIDTIETEIVVNPIFALGKIRRAMETYAKGKAKACLKEGKLI